MGGVEKAVKDNGDGTFTVEDVTGPLVINAAKAPKTFTVTVNGNAKDDVTATGTPTYGTDFTFKVDEKEYYGYTVKVTVGGADYTYANTDGTYTIKGSDITSDIVITVEKELTTLTVKFEGGAAGAATGESVGLQGVKLTGVFAGVFSLLSLVIFIFYNDKKVNATIDELRKEKE